MILERDYFLISSEKRYYLPIGFKINIKTDEKTRPLKMLSGVYQKERGYNLRDLIELNWENIIYEWYFYIKDIYNSYSYSEDIWYFSYKIQDKEYIKKDIEMEFVDPSYNIVNSKSLLNVKECTLKIY